MCLSCGVVCVLGVVGFVAISLCLVVVMLSCVGEVYSLVWVMIDSIPVLSCEYASFRSVRACLVRGMHGFMVFELIGGVCARWAFNCWS